MSEHAVVNASPIIYLARSGNIELLLQAGTNVVIPKAVSTEIRRRGSADPAVAAIDSTDWLLEVDDVSIPESVRAWDLGDGESAVLTWAMQNLTSTAIIDDRAARRCAASLNVATIGTLGLVLRAKKAQAIPSARHVLNKLRIAGMYLSDVVRDQALRLVDE